MNPLPGLNTSAVVLLLLAVACQIGPLVAHFHTPAPPLKRAPARWHPRRVAISQETRETLAQAVIEGWSASRLSACEQLWADLDGWIQAEDLVLKRFHVRHCLELQTFGSTHVAICPLDDRFFCWASEIPEDLGSIGLSRPSLIIEFQTVMQGFSDS